MKTIPYHGFRFPRTIIQHAVWLYLRFTLSLRDAEELLAERGIGVTYETVRVWVARFGSMIAKRLRSRRGPSSGIWHLDEMFVKIGDRQIYLWRAVGVRIGHHRAAGKRNSDAQRRPRRMAPGDRETGIWR